MSSADPYPYSTVSQDAAATAVARLLLTRTRLNSLDIASGVLYACLLGSAGFVVLANGLESVVSLTDATVAYILFMATDTEPWCSIIRPALVVSGVTIVLYLAGKAILPTMPLIGALFGSALVLGLRRERSLLRKFL